MSDPAYKLVILMHSRHDLGSDAFTEAWARVDRSDPVAPPGLLRYAFNAPLAGDAPVANAAAASFDAAIELWWARKNDAADWVASRAFRDRWLPLRLPLLTGRPTAIGGVPQLIWERPEPAPQTAVKVLVLPVALRRLRFQEFVDHWTGSHARLALGGPHTKERLLRLEDMPAPTPATSRLESSLYDGVGALTFASLEALAAEFGSDYYRENLAPDEVRFTDPATSATLLTKEVVTT